MSDDPRSELTRKLDLLLSIHRAELDEIALAEALYEAANGLVALRRDQAKWNVDEQVVEVPYTEAGELEAHLEDLLTTKVICVPVDGEVPPHKSIGIRIVCGTEKVDLRGRMIQQTVAGTVLQLEAADVSVQRALVGLPAVLRSNPAAPIAVDRTSVRMPQLIDAGDAQAELFPEPEPAPAQKVVEEVPPAGAATLVTGAPLFNDPHDTIERRPPFDLEKPKSEPEPDSFVEKTKVEDRAALSRLSFNMPKIDAAIARATTRNHFDFLSVHFSADTAELAERRREFVELIATCRADDQSGELTPRLDQLTRRTNEAWEVLSDTMSRRKHRVEVVPPEQIEAALQMYDGSAEAAKMSRKIDIVTDCLRRIVELQPDNYEAQRQLDALAAAGD